MNSSQNIFTTPIPKRSHVEQKIIENEKKISQVLSSNLHDNLKREMLNSLYTCKKHLYSKLLEPEELKY